jgi:two-component system sensor histidine kinase BaeS
VTVVRRVRSLRGRLLLAFTVVALGAIALVAGAALVGSSRGLSVQRDAERRDLADRTAVAAAAAYGRSGGWAGIDLSPVLLIADGGNARLVVRDSANQVVTTTAGRGRNGAGGYDPGMGNGAGMGNGTGMGTGTGNGTPVTAPVSVAGANVGMVTLIFPGVTVQAGQPVAWTWIVLAAVAALAISSGAAWLITRMLTRPLAALIGTARAFAAGDRSARTGLSAPGELGELAAAFDDAATQIQLSEQARRQMSADVAHELRTPLAALQAGLEELRDGLAPADTATLARLHDQTLRLGRVVSDLAELSSADATRLTLHAEPVDLTAVAARAADEHEPQVRAAGLTLTRDLDGSQLVDGDPGRLHQVVANLLQNCVRHCRPGDTVRLTVQPGTGHCGVRLTVGDTGPGIPPQDLPQVFTRFWRSGASAGSGLGMPIVRSIVEAHGGSVRVDSDGRTGTTVTVELPPRPSEGAVSREGAHAV